MKYIIENDKNIQEKKLINFTSGKLENDDDRNALRMKVVDVFGQEKPGAGANEKASRYKYIVETCTTIQKYNIYLQRPAWNYNGFDFAICVEKELSPRYIHKCKF